MKGQELEPTRLYVKSQGRGWCTQCRVTKKNGERCRGNAIIGGYVCHKHGGQLPSVRAAATARIRSLLPLALKVLEDSLKGGGDEAKFRAARYVIRYSGITPQNIKSVEREQRALNRANGNDQRVVKTDAEIDALLQGLMLEAGDAPGLEAGEGQGT